MTFRIEHNVETGEIIEIPLSAEEIAEREAAAAKTAQKLAEKQKEAEVEQAKRLAALSKLESLGLDLDDLKALGLG